MYSYPSYGLGDAQTHQIITSSITTGLTTAAIVDPEPFSKAALAIAAGISSLVGKFFGGCGQTCVAATSIVDQIEPYLRQNKDLYLGGPRTLDSQQTALAVFDSTWQSVLAGCGNADLGDAGKRCISDRQRGGKWDWFSYYRDPIANDTTVNANALGSGNGYGALLPIAALVLIAMWL